jgi:hypothetical protein
LTTNHFSWSPAGLTDVNSRLPLVFDFKRISRPESL